ncbi:MAG: hypothetical protein ACLQVJ_10985 [Syntrophobacteraceae bacterium]
MRNTFQRHARTREDVCNIYPGRLTCIPEPYANICDICGLKALADILDFTGGMGHENGNGPGKAMVRPNCMDYVCHNDDVIFVKTWEEVLAILQEEYPGPARVAVIPDGAMQFMRNS